MIERERIVQWKEKLPGMVMYNVRMVHGDSWKRKAEQVLKYIDVELGIGDQTVIDSLYYIQPVDRMVNSQTIIVSSHILSIVWVLTS